MPRGARRTPSPPTQLPSSATCLRVISEARGLRNGPSSEHAFGSCRRILQNNIRILQTHQSISRTALAPTSRPLHSCSGHPLARAQSSTAVWPYTAAYLATLSSQGQPFARAHCSTVRCPPWAAPLHVLTFHGQPFARAHCSTARCPPRAAILHVSTSHGQPFARAHWSTARCPSWAAQLHVHSFHGQPFA
jgi:hypothetical protein